MPDAMRRTLEREVKLVAEPGFELPELGGEPLPPRVFTSTYYDTIDRRLLAAGITLRRRVENRRGLWQLKLPSAEGRLELEAGGRQLAVELESLLAAVVRGRELQPVAVLRTKRVGVHVTRDSGVADVTHDAVSVLEERKTKERFDELEIELVSGDADVLERLRRELRDHGAKRHDGRAKIAQVLEPKPAREPSVDGADVRSQVQAALAAQYRSLISHDPGVRLGADAEDLHQARVATRRLRAILRATKGIVDAAWADALRNELSWLGSQLGTVRDADVLRTGLEASHDTLAAVERRGLAVLLRILGNESKRARGELLAAISSARYFSLLDTLELAVEAPHFGDDDRSLATIAAAEFRRLRRAVRALPRAPSDDELHNVRVRGKRARYAAELAEASSGKAGTRFIREAKRFQDLIGEHQDAVVAEGELRRFVGMTQSHAAALAAGRLIEQQRVKKREVRLAFAKAWKGLDAAGKRAWA